MNIDFDKRTSLREELGVDLLKVLLVHHSTWTLLEQKQGIETAI